MALQVIFPRLVRHAILMPNFRAFSTCSGLCEKALPPRLVIPETDLEESFLKGSGPGGQKINKTSSAVQLRHVPTGVVVKCQETRSRDQNRKIARRILADRLDMMEKGPQSRTALQQERKSKKKASATKKSRRKYRKLEEGREDKDAKTSDDDDLHAAKQHDSIHLQSSSNEPSSDATRTDHHTKYPDLAPPSVAT
jgi:protein subunit release factor B